MCQVGSHVECSKIIPIPNGDTQGVSLHLHIPQRQDQGHTALNVKIRSLKVLVQESTSTQENVQRYCVKDVVESTRARVLSLDTHDQVVPDSV